MNPVADALEELMSLGVQGPALVAAIRRLESATYTHRIKTMEEAVKAASEREDVALAKRRERLERDAQRKRKVRETCPRNSVDVHGHPQTSADDPPPPAFPPEPPQPPTPTRECISTREEREREEAGFAKFWQAYPRKTAKADARKAFAKAWRKLPPFDEELILAGGLERAKAAWTDAQFIPHAATWLNGERWQDEATIIPMKPPHERPHHDPKFERRQANLARAFASPGRAAGQRWEP
jgi:hypothetical protein